MAPSCNTPHNILKFKEAAFRQRLLATPLPQVKR